MARNTRDRGTRTAQLGAPFRELFKSLVREKIRTEADKRELAKYLDRSVSFVNQLIYYGEGGLDAWLGALTYAYKLDAAKLATLFNDYKKTLRKLSPLTEADKLWFDFDAHLSDEQKFYWVSLMRAAIDLERELGIERVTSKRKKS